MFVPGSATILVLSVKKPEMSAACLTSGTNKIAWVDAIFSSVSTNDGS